MLETKFTKGKWIIEEQSYHPGLYDQIIKSNESYVGRLRGNDIETKANAQLISAAPDMFNALRDLYDDKEVWSDLFESQKEFICRVLNKATGSSFFQH